MERLAKNKPLFIGLSCLSIGCLASSFAYPLQKLEVWRQTELGAFNSSYERTFILTENDLNYPYGFNQERARAVAQIYHDYKWQKFFLLGCAISSALSALSIGSETCLNNEIDSEAIAIKSKGRKQLVIEAIKHRLAMASKSQRLLFLDEMKTLIEEFGTPEGEILEADELNATDKFVSASYLLSDGVAIEDVVSQTWSLQPGTTEHTEMTQKFQRWLSGDVVEGESVSLTSPVSEEVFRGEFPESLDGTYWKAICKALGEGLSREEILSEVLGCNGSNREAGSAYFSWLKNRYF
jgi:hypothetical protein